MHYVIVDGPCIWAHEMRIQQKAHDNEPRLQKDMEYDDVAPAHYEKLYDVDSLHIFLTR